MTPRRRRSLHLVVGAVSAILFGVAMLAANHTRGLGVCDDAFITFRFARNLADGAGLRFNADGPTVEAASNFSLTVLLAGARLAGLSIVKSSLAIGIGAVILTLFLLAWRIQRSVGAWGLFAPLALATATVTTRNSTSGLETALEGLLLLAAVALYVRAVRGPGTGRLALVASSATLALLSMTRPEGPLYFVTLCALRAASLLRRARRRRPLALGDELAFLSGFVALYLPYFLWRAIYFGRLLPHTFYAKGIWFNTGADKLAAGLRYLAVSVAAEPLLPLGLLAGALLLLMTPSRRVLVLEALVLAQTLFMVASGGDWPHMFGYARFLYPVLPLCLFLVAELFARLVRMRRPLLAALEAIVLLAATQTLPVDARRLDLPTVYEVFAGDKTPLTRQSVAVAWQNLLELPREEWLMRSLSVFRMERYHNNFDAVAAFFLRDRYGTRTRIASIQAGQFAYWAEMPFFDLFGLVTPPVTRLGISAGHTLAYLIAEFDPKLIAFYKLDSDVHNRPLVIDGELWRAGYGLRFVIQRGVERAFVVFEKGYTAPEDPQNVLFSSMKDLPRRIDPDRWISATDSHYPRLTY
jgi:hypothetical protein